MDMNTLIARARDEANTLVARINACATELASLRDSSSTDEARISQLRAERASLETQLASKRALHDALVAERAADEDVARKQSQTFPSGAPSPDSSPVDLSGGSTGARTGDGPRWVRADTREPAALARSQRTIEHPVVQRVSAARQAADSAIVGQHGDLGGFVRALTTSGGSAIVPTVWAAQLIDLARAKAAVLQAGATVVPMDAKRVEIGRLTGDPTAAFRTEGSLIEASDPTFDNVTLIAKTLSARVVGSMEWFQDASNADVVVSDALALAMANTLDLAALYGGITAGHGSIDLATPPNPRGVLAALEATAATSVLGGATDGTTQDPAAYFDELIDLLYTVRDHNEEPNGLIWSSKAGRQYAKAYDTTGQPLQVPAVVAAVPQYVSNQVPSYTQGTMTGRATDVFAGDWTQLLIGQRLDITIQVLTERYADTGEIGIVAHWRGDVQPARPRAFAVYTGLQGAA